MADNPTPLNEPIADKAETPDVLEAELFAFLCQKYAQMADARQREMGLQYTAAETHDLAKTLASFVDRFAERRVREERERLGNCPECGSPEFIIANEGDWFRTCWACYFRGDWAP